MTDTTEELLLIEDFLEVVWEDLEQMSNVLSVHVGTKQRNGVDTHKPCITFVVSRKMPVRLLEAIDFIPLQVGGFFTDIVELAPTTWVAGKTIFNKMSPKERKRRLGAILTPKTLFTAELKTTTFESDLESKCGPILDQGDCGSCTAFGTKKNIQDTDKIQTGADYELSAEALLECAGGSCAEGNTIEAPLNYARDNGVPLEKDYPYASYDGTDYSCGNGIAPDWALRGKKLDSWQGITSKTAMKTHLMTLPLTTGMNVPDSFMNYQSGIYQPMPYDPIDGGHCIEVVGVSDNQDYWKCANSWTKDWGENGYFRIKQGVCGIDDEMYSVVLSTSPPTPAPTPTPTPHHCCCLSRLMARLRK